MFNHCFALLHTGYSQGLDALGRRLPAFLDPREAVPSATACADGDFFALDAQATRLGNLYRGMGVFTALVGLGVAVCEELASRASWLPLLRLLALSTIGTLVFLAWRTGLRAHWLAIASTVLWGLAQVLAVPAAVASVFKLLGAMALTVMGINGLLGVGGLRSAHRDMRDALAPHVLPRLRASPAATPRAHHEAMADLHVALSSRDSAWLKFASQLDLPAT